MNIKHAECAGKRGLNSIICLLPFILILQSIPVPAQTVTETKAFSKEITYIQYRIEADTQAVHVLKLDLKSPKIRLMTMLACSTAAGRETTGQMAGLLYKTNTYVCGINGDFFLWYGPPTGVYIERGIAVTVPAGRSAFIVDSAGKPSIDILTFNGNVAADNGEILPFSTLNALPKKNTVSLFTELFGEKTPPDSHTVEYVLHSDSKFNTSGNEVRYTILETDTLPQGIDLLPGRAVLAVHKSNTHARKLLNSAKTIGIAAQISSGNRIQYAIGGTPRILRDGIVSVEYKQERTSRAFAYIRHPRSAVGIGKEGRFLYMIVVDGRQKGYSVGMSLFELAEFMKNLGVYQGLNLDGGGSSTLVYNDTILNKPSDVIGPRPVANALFAVIK